MDALLGLGDCFFQQGNTEMAGKSIERVLLRQPNHALAREKLAVITHAAHAKAVGGTEVPIKAFETCRLDRTISNEVSIHGIGIVRRRRVAPGPRRRA